MPAVPIPAGDSGSSPFSSQIAPDAWIAYPMSLVAQDSHYSEVFISECTLAKLINEVLFIREKKLVDRDASQALPLLISLHSKLMLWRRTLSESLQPFTTELPSVLLLQ